MDDDTRRRIATQCYQAGTQAMSKESWDYAIDMFGKSVSLMPDNLMYRQTLRGVEKRKYKNNKSGASMAGVKLMGIRTRIKKARMKKDWQSVADEAEKGLAVNPWDAQLNADLGEACKNIGFSEVGVFAYQCALEGDPENKEWLRELALLQQERGNYSEAIKLWERIYKIDPLDGEARSKITQLEARTVMEGGYEEAKSTQDARAKTAYDAFRPAAAGAPDSVEGPGVSLEADLLHAIRKNPAIVENYLKLADHYRDEKDLEKSAEQLKKALEVSGGDHAIREQLEDVELDQLRHNLGLAQEASRAKPEDETAKKNAVALARELLRREIESLSSRVERYPKDTRYKYDLARRYMRIKKWSQAIPLLQQASADPRIETEVLVALGECFLADGKRDLGRRQFEKALPRISPHDAPDAFKKAHYLLGRICDEAGQPAQAEEHYNEILVIDYNYKDVLKRLEGLQSGGGTTGN